MGQVWQILSLEDRVFHPPCSSGMPGDYSSFFRGAVGHLLYIRRIKILSVYQGRVDWHFPLAGYGKHAQLLPWTNWTFYRAGFTKPAPVPPPVHDSSLPKPAKLACGHPDPCLVNIAPCLVGCRNQLSLTRAAPSTSGRAPNQSVISLEMLNKCLLTKSFDTVMSLLSAFLTILGLVPSLLGELDSINATIIRRSGIAANKKQK